jgi:hypothetical protein
MHVSGFVVTTSEVKHNTSVSVPFVLGSMQSAMRIAHNIATLTINGDPIEAKDYLYHVDHDHNRFVLTNKTHGHWPPGTNIVVQAHYFVSVDDDPAQFSPADWDELMHGVFGTAPGPGDATPAPTQPTTPPPVNQVPPVLSGTTQVGQTLTVNPGSWTGADEIVFEWKRDNDIIPGVENTATTYVLTPDDVGHTIKVVVVGKNAGGNTRMTTAPTTAVSPAVPAPPAHPVVKYTPSAAQGTLDLHTTITATGAPLADGNEHDIIIQWADGTGPTTPHSSAPTLVQIDAITAGMWMGLTPFVPISHNDIAAGIEAGSVFRVKWSAQTSTLDTISITAPGAAPPVPTGPITVDVQSGAVVVTVAADFGALTSPGTTVEATLAWAPGSSTAQVTDKTKVYVAGGFTGGLGDWVNNADVAPMNVDLFCAWVDAGATVGFYYDEGMAEFGAASMSGYTPPATVSSFPDGTIVLEVRAGAIGMSVGALSRTGTTADPTLFDGQAHDIGFVWEDGSRATDIIDQGATAKFEGPTSGWIEMDDGTGYIMLNMDIAAFIDRQRVKTVYFDSTAGKLIVGTPVAP